MAEIRPVEPVKLICGLIAAGEQRLEAAQSELTSAFGCIDLESGVLAFTFTDYYRDEMGDGLLRKFVSFEKAVDPGILADAKRRTNAIEAKLGESAPGRLRRRVNLDPGYVTPAKLVLATTKDFAHRIYLADGIYAEVTLAFSREGCARFPWTYPDYGSGAYDAFLLEVRRRVMANSYPRMSS